MAVETYCKKKSMYLDFFYHLSEDGQGKEGDTMSNLLRRSVRTVLEAPQSDTIFCGISSATALLFSRMSFTYTQLQVLSTVFSSISAL